MQTDMLTLRRGKYNSGLEQLGSLNSTKITLHKLLNNSVILAAIFWGWRRGDVGFVIVR